MAEIKAIKRILDAAKEGNRVICMVDEVLRGTNTIERIAANGGNDDDIPQFYSPSAPGSVDRLSIANSVLDDDNNERI